jgi:hypothetical protein
MAKVMSLPILREIAASFPEAYARTGARLFRETWTTEPGDVHTAFMMPQFVVERWREALLWSWAVARLGSDDDSWDARAAWDALRGGDKPSVAVGNIRRDTLDTDLVLAALERSGHSPPGGTEYLFGAFLYYGRVYAKCSHDPASTHSFGRRLPFLRAAEWRAGLSEAGTRPRVHHPTRRVLSFGPHDRQRGLPAHRIREAAMRRLW